MDPTHKHYLTLVFTQVLVAILVACFVMYMGPAVDRVVAGIIGFLVALVVTVWPFKVVHWHRNRRAGLAAKQDRGDS